MSSGKHGRNAQWVAFLAGGILAAGFSALSEPAWIQSIARVMSPDGNLQSHTTRILADIRLLMISAGILLMLSPRYGRIGNVVRNGYPTLSRACRRVTPHCAATALFLVAAGLALLTQYFVLEGFSISADEWEYLFLGDMFKEGRLYVELPEQLFNAIKNSYFQYRNGRMYIIVPPLYPAMLATADLLGLRFLLNPVLGAGAVVMIWLAGKTIYGSASALIAALLTLAAPFFLFNAASYFSHSSSVFFICLMLLFFVKAIHQDRLTYMAWAGACAAASNLCHYGDAFFYLLPLCIFFIFRQRHSPTKAIKGLGLLSVGAAPFVLLLLCYNHIVMGHPFATTYTTGAVSRLTSNGGWTPLQGFTVLGAWLLDLNVWYAPYLLPALPLAGTLARRRPGIPWTGLFIGIVIFQMGVFWWFAKWAGWAYGPRYLFTLLPAMSLLMGRVLSYLLTSRHRQTVTGYAAISLMLSVFWFGRHAHAAKTRISSCRAGFEKIAAETAETPASRKSVVFVSKTMGMHDIIVRNRLSCFDTALIRDRKLILANDLGAGNEYLVRLLKPHDYTFYRMQYLPQEDRWEWRLYDVNGSGPPERP